MSSNYYDWFLINELDDFKSLISDYKHTDHFELDRKLTKANVLNNLRDHSSRTMMSSEHTSRANTNFRMFVPSLLASKLMLHALWIGNSLKTIQLAITFREIVNSIWGHS